ncbi:MAG TPA: winged helix-turn-helix domain-containing protein [Terriglobales bacterium]|nr:winged helix-turn-helix domain-containing protein [Terriglobales bacterium]
MSNLGQSVRCYRFGVFQLDVVTGELYKHGIRLKLQDQPIQVLTYLLEKAGQVVSREELRQRLWGDDTYVDFDHSLNISVNKLRDALNDSASTPRFIETLPRKGYRFIAPVTVDEPAAKTVPVIAEPPPPVATLTAPAVPVRKNHNVLIFTVAGLVLVAGLILWMRSWLSHPATGPQGKTLMAVLPFENLTGNNKEDFFIAGLHEEMVTQLARLHPSQLAVIARTSAAQYREQRKPIDQLARDLHVSYVLDGSVREMGNRFRITAMLIQTSDQTQLWAETYDVNMGDMLKLQESLAHRVSDSLSVEFLPEAQRELRVSHTQNAEAYEAYLRGRYYWSFETRASMYQAIEQFQKAIDLDPSYASAYAGLADAYLVLGGYGFVPPDEAFPKGKQAAAKAIELAPELSDGYKSLSFIALYYDWNWPESERLVRKAIELDPNNPLAHEFYCSPLHVMGRLSEAEAQARMTMELDPMSGWAHDDLAWVMMSQHRPEAAVTESLKAVQLNPGYAAGHLSLAVAYTRLRQYDKATEQIRIAEQNGGDPTRVLEVLGETQALSGDTAGADATLQKLLALKAPNRISPYSVALIYTSLGKKSEAIDWLEKGYNEKDSWMPWIGVLVEWDGLRAEPRFIDLIHRMKLERNH